MKRFDICDTHGVQTVEYCGDGEYVLQRYEDVEPLMEINKEMLEALKEAALTLSGRVVIDTLSIVMNAIEKATTTEVMK